MDRPRPARAALGRQGPWSDLPLIVFTRGRAAAERGRPRGSRPAGQRHPPRAAGALEHTGQRRQGGAARPAAPVRGARPAAAARPRPTAARTSSWPCSATSCATRWRRSATPSGCSTRSARRTSRAVRQREIIERQTHHLARLVDDLLDVSRVTLGKIILQRQPVDLGDVAERCLHELGMRRARRGPRARHRRCETEPALRRRATRCGSSRWSATCSRTRSSTRRAAGDRGLVVAREDGEAVIRVRDTGVGIPPRCCRGSSSCSPRWRARGQRRKAGSGSG